MLGQPIIYSAVGKKGDTYGQKMQLCTTYLMCQCRLNYRRLSNAAFTT